MSEDTRKELSESPFEFLYKIFNAVEKETRESVGDRYFTWSEHYNSWIDIIQPLLKLASLSNSLVIIRFIEFNKILFWIQNCVYCGQYYSTLRELRFLLEFMIKAYYLDNLYPDKTIEFKIDKDKRKRLIGRKLIGKLDFSQNIKNKLNDLYDQLSAYTHPSKDELAQLMNGKVELHTTFSFNEIMFNKCVELTKKVVDSTFFIVLHRFPKVIPTIRNNDLLIKSLQDSECDLTLNYINNV